MLPNLVAPLVEIEAATGDYSTYADPTGAQSISATGAVHDVTWGSTIDSNANIQLQGNSSDIALTDGGKYLVTYNTWVYEGASGGANRRSLNSFLTLNDTPLAYGRGGGYMRDSESAITAYVNGGTIINTSASDNLQVHLQRDDNNTTAGSETVPNTNGISVVKLPDGADYLRARVAATSSSINGNTSFTDVQWDTSDEVDTDSFSFTPTSGNITLKGASGDYFIVTANVGLYDSANSGTRQNYEMRLTLGGTEIPGTVVTEYLRGTDGSWAGQLVYTGLIAKTSSSDQLLNVEVRRESTSGSTTVIPGNKAGITIMAVPNTAEVVRLTDTSGTQTTSLSPQALNFNTNDEINTSTFSHSTVSNTDQINIDADGDYLFFATAFTDTTTSGNNRQPFRVDWYKNTTIQNRGAFGSYNRANSTFTAGASGAIFFSGLTSSDFIAMKHYDETTSAPVDSTFAASRVAVQGVALNDNFYGLDVIVSASGTHTANADVPTTDLYTGGQFVIQENTSSRNVTNVTITESGTVAADTGLNNIKLYYDLDTSAPYDCASESYGGGENQFGSTDTNGFSGADGSSSFADSVGISVTSALCLYPVLDVTTSASDGQTVALSINNPITDITLTGGAAHGPGSAQTISGSVGLQNAELTQVHYHWLNDDGIEGSATSIDGAEDTSAIGFTNGVIRRLRVQVSAEGSISSSPVSLRLEYAQKITTCQDVVSWTDVGAGGGDWDISDSTFITDGSDSTDLTVANGGTTNENSSHLSPNGALKDTSSQTGSLTFASTNFLELEYAIEPTVSAPQGNTYCFRVSDAGTDLRNYDIYAEGTISADIDVATIGSQVASLDAGATTQYVGGAFTISRSGGARTITDITITETGTIDASSSLSNISLVYEMDNGDCSTQSYGGGEAQFGSTATNFSAANGSSTFSGSQSVDSSNTMCVYVLLDISESASNGDTINIEIANPSTDVLVTSSSVGPSTSISPTGNTIVSASVLTQVHYHWRNDDGNETGATSASDNSEDTPISSVPKEDARRLRIEVSNEGGVSSPATTYRLEYKTKVTTCSPSGTWTDVGDSGGAWDMVLSANISDGNTTDVSGFNFGEVTNENASFVGKVALRESTSESGSITLSSTQFTELEYSIEATVDSGYGTTYCFRVTDAGTPINSYDVYPELTTRERQDFYIQRGNEDVSGTGITLTAGVDYIAPSATSSAFVRITNSQLTGAGNTSGTSGQNADDVTAYISDQSDITSSFTISRPVAATSDTRVSWEIVEFIGLPGTDNEMIVRGVGQIAVSATNFTATGTAVSGVSDNNDVVVFVTGQDNNDTARNFNEGLYTATWNSSTNQPVFQRGDADSSGHVGYAVVEFTGLNWNVERVEHTYTTAGSPETESITAIPSVSKGFVHAQKRVGVGLTGLDEMGHQVWLSSLGSVSFQLRSGATTPSDQVSVAWVVSNIQNSTGEMTVYRTSGTIASGGPAASANSVGIGGTVNTENASVFATNDSNGSGTTFPRVPNGYSIASSTHFEIWQSNTGQPIDFQVLTVDWPVAETAIRQNYYRLYVDNDLIDPTDPWPVDAANLGENTSLTSTDDPLGEGERIRLRMSLQVNNATLPAGVGSFKLQYGLLDGSCSAISVWTDVGAPGSGTIWRGYDATPADGTELATSTPAAGTLNLSVSDVAGTYEEQNNTAVNPYAVDVGEDVEYDWLVQHNGAAQRSDYCFRMVYVDDTELDGYFNYPTIRTTGYTPVIANWQWYDDESTETPLVALGAENVSPSNIVNLNPIKLRVTASEVENSQGTNIKFALQYSTYADFSDGGQFLTSTSSCTASSTWCYADGIDEDNDIIQEALLSDADSCSGGSGNGCGNHNEGGSTVTTLVQPASSNMEFEFTLLQAAARVNTAYYFRLYDTQRGDPVVASSSYPNLVTEGAQLDFSISGLPAGTSTAGIVTDATTTATTINFVNIPMSTSVFAAQRLNVDTNATEGYQVLKYTSQQLLNSYGDEVVPITGTNAVPVSWTTGCAAEAISCFGYHVTDAVLAGGSGRFAPLDSYAALSANPEEIMYNSFPISDTSDIVYRIEVTESQPAGEYSTNINYIAVSVY